jgi:plastocyanin
MRRRISFTLTILASLAVPATAAEISGQVRAAGRSKQAVVSTVVYAEPLDGRAPARPKRVKLQQRNKTFLPPVVAVPVGSTVDFVNQDLIFHNVFSLSPPVPFDLGLYRAGASKPRTLNEPGAYRVFCNIHPDMAAVILVVPTPFITEADAAGNYRLDLPPGRYRITAWSERAEPASVEITVGANAVTAPEIALDETKFVELPHKNKFGQDYPKSGYDPLRDKKPQ